MKYNKYLRYQNYIADAYRQVSEEVFTQACTNLNPKDLQSLQKVLTPKPYIFKFVDVLFPRFFSFDNFYKGQGDLTVINVENFSYKQFVLESCFQNSPMQPEYFFVYVITASVLFLIVQFLRYYVKKAYYELY
jgi:hypothetical protein